MTAAPSHGRRRLIGAAAGLSLFALGGAGLWALDQRNRQAHIRDGYRAFEVDVDRAVTVALDDMAELLRLGLRRAGMRHMRISIEGNKILVQLGSDSPLEDAIETIQEISPNLSVSGSNDLIEVHFSKDAQTHLRQDRFLQTLNQVRTVFHGRGTDSKGILVREPRCILLPLDIFETQDRVRSSLPSRSKVRFLKIDTSIDPTDDHIPRGYKILEWSNQVGEKFPGRIAVGTSNVISGDHIVAADVILEDGVPAVTLRFSILTQSWKYLKPLYDDDVIAVVVSDQIITTLQVRDLKPERTVIRGKFTRVQAEELARISIGSDLIGSIKEVPACPAS